MIKNKRQAEYKHINAKPFKNNKIWRLSEG